MLLHHIFICIIFFIQAIISSQLFFAPCSLPQILDVEGSWWVPLLKRGGEATHYLQILFGLWLRQLLEGCNPAFPWFKKDTIHWSVCALIMHPPNFLPLWILTEPIWGFWTDKISREVLACATCLADQRLRPASRPYFCGVQADCPDEAGHLLAYSKRLNC